MQQSEKELSPACPVPPWIGLPDVDAAAGSAAPHERECARCSKKLDARGDGTQYPRYASQPLCSRQCLEARLREAIAHEHGLSTAASLGTAPRVRIGEILVEQGVITEAQLERALRSQRLTGAGRLGTWLRQQTQLPEEDFAAALSIQWQCPVFRVGAFVPQKMVGYLPRTLVEILGALPLRVSRAPEKLILCFEDKLDYELLRACERMHGIPVEGGLLASNEFWYGSGELLKASFPASCLVEASSLDEMALAMAEVMIRLAALNAQLVYVRGYYWLRVWMEAGEEALLPRDILCMVKVAAENAEEGNLAEEILKGLAQRRGQPS